MKEISTLIIIVIVGIAAIGGYFSTRYLGDDNPIEETAEEIIKAETGLDVDLSPGSPEKQIVESNK